MRKGLFFLALLIGASTAAAQIPNTPALEIRPLAGAFLPTGVQHDLFKTAPLFGLQLAYEMKPTLHLGGSFAWSPGHSKFVGGSNDVNVFQYDVGLEVNAIHELSPNWQIKPLAGVGVGARTYDYQSGSLNVNTCLAGYGALGSELQYRATAFRLEARNYVFCYDDPVLNDSRTRNEVGLSFGVAYHIRPW
jgi:outer membrane protein with beta-barrel domain